MISMGHALLTEQLNRGVGAKSNDFAPTFKGIYKDCK